MCDGKCNEAQEGDDQTNIGEGLQDYTIHMRGRANKSPCEILQVQEISTEITDTKFSNF